MTDEVKNLINNIADDLEPPDVEHIHAIAAARKQRRQTAGKVAGLAAIVLLIAGLGFWATRPDPTEVATGDDAVDASVANDSAPVEFDNWESTPVLQRRLVNTPRWFVDSRVGIPTSANPGGERVSFTDSMIALSHCEVVVYDITWTTQGFTVQRPTPIDPNADQALIGCEGAIDGIVETPMPSGLEVSIEENSNRSISLTSSEWQLTLAASGPGDDATRVYVSLPLDDAAALAEANGVEWRVVRRDGQDLNVELDLKPERLNFTTQGGIVIHVRSDAELAAQSNSSAPTTTTTEAPTPDDASDEPALAHCMSNNTADAVDNSNVDGVSLDFEQKSYRAGDRASYDWTTGTVDFVAGFYFTVECWDGDRWRSAWRAFVFDEPSYLPLSVDLGEVPAIGYGPQPGTVAIPPGAPDGTYRLMVVAVGNDTATGERIDRLQVTGGFIVGDTSDVITAGGASLDALGDALAPGDDQPVRRSHFYLAGQDRQPVYSGAERNPVFVVDIRLWRQDDGSEVIEIQFNNERVDGGGQCGTYRSGMLVERPDGLIEFHEGEYPTVDGHGFGVEESIECGSIEPVNFAPIFAGPFEISDVTSSGFGITTSAGNTSPFRLLDPDNPPATPSSG